MSLSSHALGFLFGFLDLFCHLPFRLALMLCGGFFHFLFPLRFHIASTLLSAGPRLAGRSLCIGHFLIELLLHIAGGWDLSQGSQGRTQHNSR